MSRNGHNNKFYSDLGRRKGYAGTKRYRGGVKGSKHREPGSNRTVKSDPDHGRYSKN